MILFEFGLNRYMFHDYPATHFKYKQNQRELPKQSEGKLLCRVVWSLVLLICHKCNIIYSVEKSILQHFTIKQKHCKQPYDTEPQATQTY